MCGAGAVSGVMHLCVGLKQCPEQPRDQLCLGLHHLDKRTKQRSSPEVGLVVWGMRSDSAHLCAFALQRGEDGWTL